MAAQLHFNWLPFVKFSVVLLVYIFAGGLLIFYLEECRRDVVSVPKPHHVFSGNVTVMCLKLAGDVFMNAKSNSTSPGKSKSVLDLSSFIERCRALLNKEVTTTPTKLDCTWNWKNLRKWIKFIHNTLATIGYHDFQAQTDIGKTFLIFYSMLGVPFAILCYIHFGSIVRVTIRKCIRRVESHCCNRTEPRNIRHKTVLYNVMLIILVVAISAGIVSNNSQFSYMECFYYFTGTITTSGNEGQDMDTKFFNSKMWLSIVIDILQVIGLGLVSSLIQSGIGLRRSKKKRQNLPLNQINNRNQDNHSTPHGNGPGRDVVNGTVAMDSLVILVRNDKTETTPYT